MCLASVSVSAQEPSTTIETVKVTGDRLSLPEAQQAIAEIPGGATLVDMSDLSDRNVSSLADALRYVPGVFSNSTSGTDGIFFSSRGSNLDATDYDMNGIKLLQDGLPITAADGNNHNRLIDPLSTRYATVARGANALTYGASTLGGAIAFVSPTARNSDPLEVQVNGGSFGQLQGRATVSGELGDALDGLLTVEGKEWDGYRDHNKQTRYGAYGNTGWQVTDDVTTRLYGSYIQNDQELAGSLSEAQVQQDPDQASPAAIGGDYQLNVDTWRLANTTTWQIDPNRSFFIGFSIEEQKLRHPIVDKIMVDFDGPGPDLPVEVFSLLIDTGHRDVGAALRYEQRIGAHELLFGLNYGDDSVDGNHYRNDGGDPNGVTEEIDNSARSVEGFALDRWQFSDRWTLIAGAQFVAADREAKTRDVATGAVSNPNDDFSTVNPRAGVIYAINDHATVYTNVSRLYEPPTNFELADDVNGGNHVLDPMQGIVVEVGTRGRGNLGERNSWGWELEVYQAWIQDEILSVDDPNAPGTSLSTNVDETIHAGIEALVDFRFALDESGTHTIVPLVTISLNDFSFDNDDVYGSNQLPAAPDYVVRGEILYRHSNGLFVGPTFDMVGERYADFVNSYTVNSYNLLGLRAGWDRGTWRVYAEFHNALDEHYIATTGVRDVAAADAEILNPGAPRAVFVGVQARL
jgi:iron complex outermembrane receptor protein